MGKHQWPKTKWQKHSLGPKTRIFLALAVGAATGSYLTSLAANKTQPLGPGYSLRTIDTDNGPNHILQTPSGNYAFTGDVQGGVGFSSLYSGRLGSDLVNIDCAAGLEKIIRVAPFGQGVDAAAQYFIKVDGDGVHSLHPYRTIMSEMNNR